jgi:hypothetical protein
MLQDGGRPAWLKVGLSCNWIFVALTTVACADVARHPEPGSAHTARVREVSIRTAVGVPITVDGSVSGFAAVAQSD